MMQEEQQILWDLLEVRDETIQRMNEHLFAKEQVIQKLKSLAGKAAEIEEVSEVISQYRKCLLEKEALIEGLSEATSRYRKSLVEKEAVIEELSGAVSRYRTNFAILGYLLRPANRIKATLAGFKYRLRALAAPRLGNLNQYAPRPIHLPESYEKVIALSVTPKVSIVTPSYNQAGYIGRTMDSVLGQNYPNLEYFVQDGGSQDGTVEVLKVYSNQLSGWESKPDKGQSQAINLSFARTTGEIMAWLNSDDILLPGAIHAVVEYFNRHPEVDVVYGNRLLIDENDMEIGRWIMPGHDSDVLSWADYVPQESLFWRRRIWDRVGGKIDESFKFAMDWDLLVRFRDAGAHFAHIPRFMGAFRIHEHQKTSAVINEIGLKEMGRIRGRLLGRIPSHNEVRRAVLPFLHRHFVRDFCWRVKQRMGLI